MIRTVKVLYCGNDHGTGDVTFPELHDLNPMQDVTAVQLRRNARAAGWIRTGREDYCPICAPSITGKEAE